MTRRFFFDDVREPPDGTWTVARNVEAAKAILSGEPFEVWSLDHDIGFDPDHLCQICQKAPESKLSVQWCHHQEQGTALAEWAVENIHTWPRLILIHSANPVGARQMQKILQSKTKVVRIPFRIGMYVGI